MSLISPLSFLLVRLRASQSPLETVCILLHPCSRHHIHLGGRNNTVINRNEVNHKHFGAVKLDSSVPTQIKKQWQSLCLTVANVRSHCSKCVATCCIKRFFCIKRCFLTMPEATVNTGYAVRHPQNVFSQSTYESVVDNFADT